MFSVICGISMSICDVTVTQYLNIPHFVPVRGVSGPLRRGEVSQLEDLDFADDVAFLSIKLDHLQEKLID